MNWTSCVDEQPSKAGGADQSYVTLICAPKPKNFGVVPRVLISLAAVVVIIAALHLATWLFLPVAVAVFITMMVAPVMKRLRGWGVPDWAGISMVMLATVGLLLATGVLVSRSLQDLLETLSRQRGALEATLGPVAEDLYLPGSFAELSASVEAGALWGHVSGLATSFFTLSGNLVFVIIMVGFMLIEAKDLREKLDHAFGAEARRREKAALAVDRVRRYVWIKTIISLATGVFAGVSCWVAGLETPLLWGLLAFALNYIPMLGSLVAAIPPVLLALTTGGWVAALGLTGAYLFINILMANIIEPRVLGPRLGLSPAVILISLLFWGWVFGPIGMLLAVPFTMIVRSYCDYHPSLHWLSVLLGSQTEIERARRRGRRTMAPPRDTGVFSTGSSRVEPVVA